MKTERTAGVWMVAFLASLASAPGCDKLGLGKSESKSEKKSDDDDDKDTKKKTKKHAKKADDDDADDKSDDGEKDPAVKGTAPTATASAGGASAGSTCEKYLAALDCIMGKMPEQAAAFQSTRDQMKQAFAQYPAQSADACKQGLDSIQSSLVQVGCATGGATASSASPGAPDTLPPSTGGHSGAPTQAEWDAVTTEVGVIGSGKLNCETKMVRDWLRVSCHGKNSTGGTPIGVSVTKGGGRGDDFALSTGGITSLVVRFVEGIDLDASFSWTDGTRVLHVTWPRNMPEPKIKGVFDDGHAVPSGSRACHANTECPPDNFCMPDGKCHPAAEVQ